MVVNPQLVGCAGPQSYPVKDSGIYAEEADLVWLDNQRVLFHGYKSVEIPPEPNEPFKPHRFIGRALYLWDTIRGSVEVYDTFEKRSDGFRAQSTLCVHDGVLTYIKHGVIITGKQGEETRIPFPKQRHWFNPFSCRYDDTKPFWVVEGHRTIPLLEEHGYLDLGSVIPPRPDPLTLRWGDPNPAITFYSVKTKKSITLPIGWQEVGVLQVHYAPFRNKYLLSGLQYFDKERDYDRQPIGSSSWPHDTPHRVWWLASDGNLEKEDLPMVAPLLGNGARGVPVRDGLFVLGNTSPKRYNPRGSGGYLVKGKEVVRMTAGIALRMVVSPDGCQVAMVNDTYAEGKSVSERIRLHVVRLCSGE